MYWSYRDWSEGARSPAALHRALSDSSADVKHSARRAIDTIDGSAATKDQSVDTVFSLSVDLLSAKVLVWLTKRLQ